MCVYMQFSTLQPISLICRIFHAHSGSVGRNKFNQLNRSIFGILPMIKYGMFHMILLCQASVGYLSELSCSSELIVGHSELKYWAHFSIFWHINFCIYVHT